MERLSTSPLHRGDGLLGKQTENLEAKEEFNIIMTKGIHR